MAGAYGLAGALGLWLSGGGPSLFWPAAGVAVAAAARFGWRAAPGLVAGTLAVKLAGGHSVLLSVAVGTASLAGAAFGGWLLRREAPGRPAFGRLGDVGGLVVAAALGALPAAVVGPVALWAGGSGGASALVWWLGDAAGILLVAPVLLNPAPRARLPGAPRSRMEAAVVWTGLAAAAVVAVWFTVAPNVLRFPATTACLPLLAVAAVRFGPRGAALANLFTAGVVVGIVVVAETPRFNLVLVAFLAVASLTALSLGAVTAERDAAVGRLAADIAARVAAEEARRAAEADRRLAEAALDADRKRFAALLEHSHDVILVLTADGRVAYVSDAVARLTGRAPADLAGRYVFEHVHGDDVALARPAFADCLARPGLTTRTEFRVRTADGRWVWLEAIATNHLDNPAVGGVVVNVRDVTERREAEGRLRDARALLEATGRMARIGGWEYVIPEDRLVWSEQTYRIHDVTPGQYTPTAADAVLFYAPEARPAFRAAFDRGAAAGEPWNLVLPFVTDTGRRLWVNSIGQAETRGGRPYRLYGTFQDVTERVESERAARESEARYRNLFESAPVAIWEEDFTAVAEWFDSLRAAGVTDLAAHLAAHPGLAAVVARMIRVRDVNAAAVAMNRAAGKDDLAANLHRLFTPEALDAFAGELAALWRGERTLRLEARAARLDGRRADVVVHVRVPEAEGRPDFSRVVVIALDVTEQKRLEEQFRQSQKLEAVGRLAGGIAHDFNNLLTVINGFAELILANNPPGAGPHDLAAHIRDAGGRAADLTRQLLAFSRKQPAAAGPLDLAAAVGALGPLFGPLVGSSVRVVMRLNPVPPVRADKGQFEQVVMNLVVNARDAMPAGGTLTLTTDVVEAGAPDGADVPPGRWVVFSVADTGTGIREDAQPHLFEPFFTTKELGRGTGLGLSTVYGIVTGAGGHLRYETAPGRGTTFRVYLPAADAGSDGTSDGDNDRAPGRPEDESAPAGAGTAGAPPGAARVLLVEDQPEVRTLATQILEGAGFAVTAAADGAAALEALAALPEPPGVMVTDVQMPGMSGRELADRVRARWPEVRVLLVSGFSPEPGPAELAGAAFLAKPFSPEELLGAVRKLVAR